MQTRDFCFLDHDFAKKKINFLSVTLNAEDLCEYPFLSLQAFRKLALIFSRWQPTIVVQFVGICQATIPIRAVR